MSEDDVIYSKINIVKNCLMAIEKARRQESDPEFKISLYEINLQRAIQACIDMSNVIIAREGMGLPNTYRQAFDILSKNQVIDNSMASIMKKMVGFRNISVHDYQEINPEVVEKITEVHLVDFERYYQVIYNYVQSWSR